MQDTRMCRTNTQSLTPDHAGHTHTVLQDKHTHTGVLWFTVGVIVLTLDQMEYCWLYLFINIDQDMYYASVVYKIVSTQFEFTSPTI